MFSRSSPLYAFKLITILVCAHVNVTQSGGETVIDAEIAKYLVAVEHNPESVSALCSLSGAYMKKYTFSDGNRMCAMMATQVAFDAVSIDEYNPKGYLAMARIARAQGNHIEAAARIQEARECIIRNTVYAAQNETVDKEVQIISQLLVTKGMAAVNAGDWPTVMDNLEISSRLKPGNDSILYQLGVAYGKRHLWAKAIACYDEILVKNPGNMKADINRDLARKAYKQGFQSIQITELSQFEVLDGRWEMDHGVIRGSGGYLLLRNSYTEYSCEFLVNAKTNESSTIGIGIRGNMVTGGQRRFRNNTSDIDGFYMNFSFRSRSFNLFKRTNGISRLLKPEWKTWPRTDLLKTPPVRIRLDVKGSSAQINLNGQFLARIDSPEHPTGDLYFYVKDKNIDVTFSEIWLSAVN